MRPGSVRWKFGKYSDTVWFESYGRVYLHPNTLYEYRSLALLLIFEILFSMWKSTWFWILLSFNIWLQLSKPPIFYDFQLAITKNKNCPFSEALQTECEWLDINIREIATITHVETIFMLVAIWAIQKIYLNPDDIIRDIQTTKYASTLIYRNLNWLLLGLKN